MAVRDGAHAIRDRAAGRHSRVGGRVGAILLAVALALATLGPAAAEPQVVDLPSLPELDAEEIADRLERVEFEETIDLDGIVQPSTIVGGLLSAEGEQRVVVRLTEEPLSVTYAKEREDDEDDPPSARGGAPGRSGEAPGLSDSSERAQRSQSDRIEAQQDRVAELADRLGAIETGRLDKSLNALTLKIDADSIPELAAHPDVERVAPVIDYELHLDRTVEQVGASTVQDLGLTGEGVTVAVFDSGVDYTHKNLGGSGKQVSYLLAYGPNASSPKNTRVFSPIVIPGPPWAGPIVVPLPKIIPVFPNAKFVDGYDFVGEFWPDGELNPNPNPIDVEGHGTSVADIIAGVDGVAPDAGLVAVKVCASYAPSCSGEALLQGMDFVLGGGGDTVNPIADIINMSLGANYGIAFEDDLSAAVENATQAGVLTVSSAGNGADKPFVSGTPAGAPSALSVAQTGIVGDMIDSWSVPTDGEVFAAVPQDWGPSATDDITAPTVIVRGNELGCEPFDEDLSGQIVVMQRGDCEFTDKFANATDAGATAGVMALTAPGDPFTGGAGARVDEVGIPSYFVTQAAGEQFDALFTAGGDTPVETTIGLDAAPADGALVGSSSRGPSMDNLLKPEIGAPGASVAAVAGSGTGTQAFGGTSGASPMVAGAAALLLSSDIGAGDPAEVKAALMNTAERDIVNFPLGEQASVTRIGGGELRVDRALEVPAVAYVDARQDDDPRWRDDNGDLVGQPVATALSYGQVDVSTTVTIEREVTLRDRKGAGGTYSISLDQTSMPTDAVSVDVPSSVEVPAGGETVFTAAITIDAGQLPDWVMSSGGAGADAASLDAVEFGGYLVFDALTGSRDQSFHLPWHVLPRAVAETEPLDDAFLTDAGIDPLEDLLGPTRTIDLYAQPLLNTSSTDALLEAFSLVGTSPQRYEDNQPGDQFPELDLRSAGVSVLPEVCGTFITGIPGDPLVRFATTTWQPQTHANSPLSVEWNLDITGDGLVDYAVFNFEIAQNLSDGRNAVFALDVSTGQFFPTFLTEHPTNSAITVLSVCGSDIGMVGEDIPDTVAATVFAVDLYYGSSPDDLPAPINDVITDVVFSPLASQVHTPLGPTLAGTAFAIPATGAGITVVGLDPEPAVDPELTTESGVLWLSGQPVFDGLGGSYVTEWRAPIPGSGGDD